MEIKLYFHPIHPCIHAVDMINGNNECGAYKCVTNTTRDDVKLNEVYAAYITRKVAHLPAGFEAVGNLRGIRTGDGAEWR